MTDNKIQLLSNGKLLVPDHVIVPFITGDGIGPEIMPAMQQVVDTAVKVAYKGSKQLLWTEVPAGQRAYDTLGTYLPNDTLKPLPTAMWALKVRSPHLWAVAYARST